MSYEQPKIKSLINEAPGDLLKKLSASEGRCTSHELNENVDSLFGADREKNM